jgi:uncharacterized protein with gpF-like domain
MFDQTRIGNSRTLAEQVADFVKEESFKGRRASAIAGDLVRQFPKVAESRIAMTARTQVSKASTALARARAENLGLGWYVWRTSREACMRKAQRFMDGILIAWAEPPSPESFLGVASTLGEYHAGDCPNCRCYPEPVVRIDLVAWPAKVYHDGRIQRMTRSRFGRISGMEASRAA